MTQLDDGVRGLGDDGWYAGRLHAVPDLPDQDDERSRPLGAVPDTSGEWDRPNEWDSAGYQPPAPSGSEPLFEQLRSAYLYRDDANDWARDSDSGGWASDDSGGWAADDSGGWAADDSGRWEAGGAAVDVEDDDRYRWVESPEAWESGSEAGWDDEAEEHFLDDEEEDELDLVPRARAGRRPRSAQGRAGLRRTSTLLNTSSVLLLAVGVLAAAGLSVWILSARLLTTRQLFFLTHSIFGIIIVHAFGGGLGTLLTSGDSRMKDKIRKLSTAALAVVAWLASGIGTWFGYAGYRAEVPPGGDITMYPREYLLSSPQLAFWETFAMEWKVHIGWTTPFLATAVAFTALRYRRRLVADRLVRKVMTIMLLLAFAGALVAAGLGAVVNVTAPNDFMHRGWSP
jgi:hypothetical protein